MRDVDNQIRRLEMRAEQLALHLQDLARNSSEAATVRAELYGLLRKAAELKAESARRRALLEDV